MATVGLPAAASLPPPAVASTAPCGAPLHPVIDLPTTTIGLM
jgi:hypothetical protein